MTTHGCHMGLSAEVAHEMAATLADRTPERDKEALELLAGGNEGGVDDEGNRRQEDSREVAKRTPEGTRMLLEVLAWQLRQRDDGSGGSGGGKVLGSPWIRQGSGAQGRMR